MEDYNTREVIAYYDPATGAFYISERTIPDNVLKSGRLIELVRK